jgi:hypothetical protein
MSTLKHSLAWTILVVGFGLGAFAVERADAQTPASEPLPAGVTTCQFDAFTNHYPSGAEDRVIRDAPRSDARVLGHLPMVEVTNVDFTESHQEIAQFRVIGFKDGWFLIEGAHYPEASTPLYSGQGWVEGKFITTHLYRDTLKQAPSYAADDVVYLNAISPDDGIPGSPYTSPLRFGITGCSGPWFEVEVGVGFKTPSGQPVPGNGPVRGWTDRSCTQQSDPCSAKQFDYPWSPLPAGVTECNFGALSNDRDPAGLTVLEAPDTNAAVLGRLLPPTVNIGGDAKIRAQVQVIGFRKGWFLIEAGPNLDLPVDADPDAVVNPPPENQHPYVGRGWVPGNMLTAWLLRNRLKQTPDEKSADVVDLSGGGQSDPQEATVRRIIACSGDWVRVEVELEKDIKPLLATDAAKGAVRGWANGTCTAQLMTCGFSQDTPWSPPAALPPE